MSETTTYKTGDVVVADIRAIADSVTEAPCPECGCGVSDHDTNCGDHLSAACRVCSGPGSACVSEAEFPEFVMLVEARERAEDEAYREARWAEVAS